MKKRVIDIIMTVLLLFLMAYQVTGEVLHEWIGIAMTVLVIVHQILNRRWYKNLFKGKYNTYRIVTTVNNTLLLCAFALTAFCGMAMSGHAVPFLYGMTSISFARSFHLAMSHWSFVLMGLHLGLHVPAMIGKMKLSKKLSTALTVVWAAAAGYGLFLFLRSGMSDYMFFRVPFAFLDYEKSKVLVILENLLMLIFWAFTGSRIANLCMAKARKDNPLLPVVFILLVIVIGYPNWWASIPMPIATFLESYDFAGKRIIPFCSHGGGRFGQSLTAIAKLAPDAVMGQALSISYLGGSSLPENVASWLDANGIERH